MEGGWERARGREGWSGRRGSVKVRLEAREGEREIVRLHNVYVIDNKCNIVYNEKTFRRKCSFATEKISNVPYLVYLRQNNNNKTAFL